MEKVVKITHLKDKTSAYSFWMTKSYDERLAAVEMLSKQYIDYIQNAQPRLQSVCTIINSA